MKTEIPVYQQIAIDIAAKIADRRYRVGDKIYARSSLAGQYGVSPETARRAICILSEMEIVDTTKGSGVVIKSYENAMRYVHEYHQIQTVNELKKTVLDTIEHQREETAYLYDCVIELVDKVDRFRSINPFVPFEIKITDKTPYLDKSVSESNFWQNTAATVVAVRRNGELIVSPGPDVVFMEDDIVYFIGKENCQNRVKQFLYPDSDVSTT